MKKNKITYNRCTSCTKRYNVLKAVVFDVEEIPFELREELFKKHTCLQFCSPKCKGAYITTAFADFKKRLALFEQYIMKVESETA